MKLRILWFLFFIFSILLIMVTLKKNVQSLYDEYRESIRIAKIQKFSNKRYPRLRKTSTAERSFVLANLEIQNILQKESITFKANTISSLVKPQLIKIVNILNHIKEDVALSIAVYTKAKGSGGETLKLSQKQADVLKAYFIQRTTLPLIVAIGYGETLSDKHKGVVLNLKRIKQ